VANKTVIVHRWTGRVLWEGEAASMREALERARDTGADLTGADLTDADLTGAVLTGADLTDADLTGAVLTGADLTDALLTGAVLTGADLTGADLTRAVLTDALLTGADLTGADLTGADLTPFRDDLWAILSGAPAEVPILLDKLRAGQIDGSCYQGDCACLVGTLANARHCDYRDITTIEPNGSRPAERWFAMIKPGGTPQTNQAAQIAETWIVDWLTRVRAAFGIAA